MVERVRAGMSALSMLLKCREQVAQVLGSHWTDACAELDTEGTGARRPSARRPRDASRLKLVPWRGAWGGALQEEQLQTVWGKAGISASQPLNFAPGPFFEPFERFQNPFLAYCVLRAACEVKGKIAGMVESISSAKCSSVPSACDSDGSIELGEAFI